MPGINDLSDLLIEEMKDLYFVEKHLAKALPKMAKKANDEGLRDAFNEHAEETNNHILRLEEAFELLGKKARAKTCDGIKGILDEAKSMMEEAGDEVMDAVLITCAQRAEHYEMAGYGAIRTYAQLLGHKEVAKLLQQNLDEEGAADKKLTKLAETCANPEAMPASGG